MLQRTLSSTQVALMGMSHALSPSWLWWLQDRTGRDVPPNTALRDGAIDGAQLWVSSKASCGIQYQRRAPQILPCCHPDPSYWLDPHRNVIIPHAGLLSL